MKKRRISVLTGAGASIPAGMPKTDELTCRILSGEGVVRDNKGTYCLGEPQLDRCRWPDEYVLRVSKLANMLYSTCKAYYKGRRHETNYEDIYYLAWQVYHTGNTNPAIVPFVKALERDTRDLLSKREHGMSIVWRFLEAIRELINYMECVVWMNLAKSADNTSHLEFISELHSSDSFELRGILTLNHDIVLESFMTRASIPFFNGFRKQESSGCREWIGFDNVDYTGAMPYVKLHGSLLWFRFKKTETEGEKFRELELSDDEWRYESVDGRMPWPESGRPEILIGTSNKLQAYNFGQYVELYAMFRKILGGADVLIVVGYSFGDIGVNATIRSWLDSDEGHYLLIIDLNIKEQIQSAPEYHWIKKRMEKSDQIIIIPKGVEKVDLKEVMESVSS